MGIETYTTPGYDVDATIALKIRPSENDDLNIEEELDDKSYVFHRVMALVMAMLPFWLLFFLPFKVVTYKDSALAIADANVLSMLRNFFAADFAGSYLFGVLPILTPSAIAGSTVNGLFFYLIILSIPLCGLLALVALFFRKTAPGLLRSILCIEIFLYAGYLLSLIFITKLYGVKGASILDLPSIITVGVSLLLYVILSAIRGRARSLLGILFFLLTMASICSILLGFAACGKAVPSLLAERSLYKTLATVVLVLLAFALIFALAGMSAKKLRGVDVFFSCVLLYLGVRITTMAIFEKAFAPLMLFAIISTVAALAMLLIQLLVLKRRKARDPKKSSILVNAETDRRTEAAEREKVLAWRNKKAKKDLAAMNRKARKAEKALEKQAKRNEKAKAKQAQKAKKQAKLLEKEAKLAADPKNAEKLAKKREKQTAQETAKAAKALKQQAKQAQKAKKAQAAKTVQRRSAKSDCFFYRIIAMIFALIPVLLFLILKTTVFNKDYIPTSKSFIAAFGDLSAAFAPRAGLLNSLNGILFCLIPVAMLVGIALAVIAIFKPKHALKLTKIIFMVQGLVFGAYSMTVSFTTMFGGASFALDMPSLIASVVTLVGYVVLSVLKNGKRTFLGLTVYLLSFAAAGAIIFAIASKTASIRALYKTNELLKLATLLIVMVYAISIALAYLGISVKKLCKADVIRCWVMIYLAVRVVVFSFLRTAYKDFLIFGIIALAASVILLIVEAIALKCRKKAELIAKYADYTPAPIVVTAPAATTTATNAKETVAIATEIAEVVATQTSTYDLSYDVAAVTPVSCPSSDVDLYGVAFDPFIGTLTFEERKEFIYLFMVTPYPGVPAYNVGGDNQLFFRKVFVNLGSLRDQLSDSLMEKIYQYAVKL